MTGIITRSHRVTCARCTDLPKEKSCCNVVRHLIAATDLHKKPAKACTRGVYNENKVKVMGSKNGFCREVDKKIAQNAKHSETSVSLEKEDLWERPAAPVYKRITRAKSKYISGTETTCNDIRGDVACNDARNTTKGKNSNTRAREPKVHTGENNSQVDIEFGEQNQGRMIEVRMTRSKKNLLLQMQPDKENAGAGCLHGHTNEESCLADSDKNPIFTHDPTLQRKRKRMSAMMYGLGHEDSYCISEKGLGSDPQTKREFPFRAITRSAIHKQNASATINNQTIWMDRQSSAELQNQCKEVEVTHQELTVHPKSQEKLKSCKWKDLNENMSSPGLLRIPDKNSMQNNEIPLGSKDSKSSRNLRNSKSTVDKEIVNPVQVRNSSPQKKLREKVVECTMEGARRAKVIAMASIPKRMTRSMQKDSLELELVQINEKPVITRKRKHQDAYHSMIPRKSLRIKSQSSSVTVACAAETQLRGESCVEDDNSLKINSEEPLNSTGKLKDKDQCNSRSNDASEKLNLSESIKGVEDLQGKGHLCRISKKREKQNYDMRRKEYLTRSKHDKRNIQEEKENHSSLKAEGSTTPCYKNEPNSSSKGSGYADVAPPTDELIVLPPIESAMLDTSVRQFSVDTDSEDHLSLKRKGEAKSSLQDTSGLERTEKKSVDNQPSSTCYEQICNDIIPETPGYENGFCNSSGKLNLSENIQGLEDLAGKGHLCRIPKRKEKLKYDMPRKEYLTRSKHDKRNIQEDKEEHSSLKAEGSTTLCYKNGLNPCTKGPREVVVPPPTDVSIVLPPVESAKVDNSARQSSMDPDGGDHLKLKREGETKSSVQDTLGLEHMEKTPVDNLPSFPCYEQICNDTIPEALGNTNGVGEIQSGTPLVVSNIDQGVKSGDLAGSNGGPLKVSAHHVESSHGFDGNSCPESKRETCETTFISKIYSKPAKKSHECGVDEHDCVQQDEFIMGEANRKCFKIMTNPNDLGGRQMRPRPLDPLQPLPVFIEGRDQEFHDFNTVSFQWHPRHHGEEKFSIAAVMDSEHKSLSLKSKKQEIKIPSYRTVPDYDEVRRNLNGGKSVYTIPGSYIRHIEMSANNLMNISKYDIEDDDQEWLRSFNQGITERKAALQLTEDKFEELIEYFEKESAKVPADRGVKVSVLDSLRDSKDKWNPISEAGKKEIVFPCRQSSSMLSSVPQTSDCCICNGGEDSVSNSVYRCKSCGIYVHHSCYGVHDQQNAGRADNLQISDWICRKCEAFGSANVNICCAICCKNGGALKPTTNPTKWAHVVCALYTNETFFLDSDSMEPIDGVSAVEVRSRRQKRLCCFCGARVGSCERCSVYGCGAVFHISCGVNQGAYFEMQHNNQEVVNVRSFCPRHANDTHHGLIEEGSNVKDVFQIPIKDDASVPKRQRRRMLRHRIKSAVRLNRCKTVSRNKMLFVDDSLHAHKGANSSLLYLMGTSEQQQGPQSSNNMQNKGANLGLVEGSVSGKLNANISERNQFIELKEVLKANIGPAFVVREVYSYWLGKRAQKKGPLLQKLQQEETAKTHGIFNQDSAAIREYFGLKEDLSDKLAGCSSVDFEMVLRKLRELQKGLKSVRSMAEVVINREKIKAQLVSEFSMLAQTKLFALQEELSLISCFLCNSSENLLLCQQCKRIFCFQCYKHWKVHGVKSYRILSCGKCFCKDCEVVYKTDSVNSALENFSVMSKTDDKERIIQVANSLGRSLETTVKPDGECRTKGLERKNTSLSRSITNGVCSVPKNEAAEDTDSKADASIDPNKQAINDTCSFPPFTTDTGSLKVMDGHPLDGKGRQQSPCKTALLSDLTVAVNLNNGSLGKIPSNDCHKNVQKTRSKRRN